MMSIVSARYDIARFGAEVFRSSPRQADLLIVSGRVAHKMAAPLRQIYDQMLEPKWVIAMGACASSGGMFNNYAVLQGVDKIVAVDIHVPGCPPRPEALDRGDRPAAGEDPRGRPARIRHPRGRGVTLRGRSRARRDEGGLRRDDADRRPGAAARGLHSTCATSEGFNFLADLAATDYLGWRARSRSPATSARRPGATSTRPARRASRACPSRSRSASA